MFVSSKPMKILIEVHQNSNFGILRLIFPGSLLTFLIQARNVFILVRLEEILDRVWF